MENSKKVKIAIIDGKIVTFFRLENGEVKVCVGQKQCQAFMKKIDRGEVKIIDFEEDE